MSDSRLGRIAEEIEHAAGLGADQVALDIDDANYLLDLIYEGDYEGPEDGFDEDAECGHCNGLGCVLCGEG